MQKYGVARRVVSRDELLQIEPGLRGFADQIVGGTYTPSDESGDARVFTQALARRCAERGVQFMYGHDVVRLQASGGTLDHVVVRDRATRTEQVLRGGAVVAAVVGWFSRAVRKK